MEIIAIEDNISRLYLETGTVHVMYVDWLTATQQELYTLQSTQLCVTSIYCYTKV